jgi:hypothetical protein
LQEVLKSLGNGLKSQGMCRTVGKVRVRLTEIQVEHSLTSLLRLALQFVCFVSANACDATTANRQPEKLQLA